MLFDPFAPFGLPSPSFGRAGFLAPTDVTMTDGEMVLTFDLPGMSTDELEIEALDGQLVVRGERRRPELADGAQWVFAERTFGGFERRIQLPQGVDRDAITATMEHGVLTIVVPLPETPKPRTIEIESGSQQRELEAAVA